MVEDWLALISNMNGAVRDLHSASPEVMKTFSAMAVAAHGGSALDGKTKELIGLAVSAQIPCHYCVYFHTAAARLNGATDQEIREAVGMAAISRHWSTVLNGMQVDTVAFKNETDTVLRLAGEKAKSASK